MMEHCTFQDLARARQGRYFDLQGLPCGLAMEVVETKGGTKLMCPVHDRYPNYVPSMSA